MLALILDYLVYLTAFAFLLAIAIVFAPTAKAQTIVYPAYARPINVRILTIAIAKAENWDGKSIGAAGERGRLQFTATTWFKFSHKPHHWAERRSPDMKKESDAVEFEYIMELQDECRKMGRAVTPYMIALLHNAGGPTVASNKVPAAKRDFAQRALNLYEAMTK